MTIDELRELGERATKGPWRSIDHDQDEWWMYAFGVGPALVSYQPDDSTAFARSEADVALIAAARTHWDALLAIAEAAEAWRIASTSFDVNVATTESSRAFDLIRAVDKFKESIR